MCSVRWPGVPGVQEATVDLLANQAHVTAPTSLDMATLTAAVRNAGYDVVAPRESALAGQSGVDAAPSAEDEPGSERGRLGLRALLALLAGAIAMVLSMPLMGTGSPAGSDLLTTQMSRFTMPLLPAWLLGASPNLLRWILLGLALATMIFAAPENLPRGLAGGPAPLDQHEHPGCAGHAGGVWGFRVRHGCAFAG